MAIFCGGETQFLSLLSEADVGQTVERQVVSVVLSANAAPPPWR